jgi:hypothetical protein
VEALKDKQGGMRVVIDGRIYDTATATEVGEVGSGSGVQYGDFGWWTATLYRTQRGRFFIKGRGGARSPFAKAVQRNAWIDGSGIRAVDTDDALRMAEQAGLPVETLEEFFTLETA